MKPYRRAPANVQELSAPSSPAINSRQTLRFLSRSGRTFDVLALLFFLGFALALCAPVLTGKVPVAANTLYLWAPWSGLPHEPVANTAIADSALLYLPWNHFARAAVAAGEWPLWDPHTFAGASFAANSQSQLYYPLTWLLWLLPLSAAIQALAIFNIWLAGAGMYFFIRSLGVSRAAALVAGLGFAGSGLLQLALETPGHSSVYGWLPWMFLSADRALKSGSIRWSGAAVLLCGLQLVSGNLQWAIYSYFALFCWTIWYAVARWRGPGFRSAASTTVRGGAILVGGVALAAVHLAPVLELSSLSTRTGVRVSSHSAPLYQLLRLFMPQYFGTSVGDVGLSLTFNELWYVGVGTLCLAFLGLALHPTGAVWFWAAMAAFAVCVAYGIGPFLYVRWLPGLSGLLPSRIGYLFIFSACVLAGIGFDAWLRACRERVRFAFILLLALLTCLVAVLAASMLAQTGTEDGKLAALQAGQIGRAAAFFAAFILLLGSPVARQWWRKQTLGNKSYPSIYSGVYAIAFILISCADLLTMAPGYNTFVPPEQLTPGSAAVDWLHAQSGFGRVMGLGVGGQIPTFVPNVQTLYDFYSVDGYDSFHTRRYEEFWGAVDSSVRPAGSSLPYANVFLRPQAYTSTVASLLNVRYIASASPIADEAGFRKVYDGEIKIYENPNALPRAFIVGGARVLPSAEVLHRLSTPDFDPRAGVLLEQGECPPDIGNGNGNGNATGISSTVTITSYLRNSVTLTSEMMRAGWLVLADANYPGWNAKVDGQDQKVYTAYYALRAIPLSAGRHTVVFSFTPTAYWPTLALSLSVLLVVAIAIVGNGWPLRLGRGRSSQ